MNPFDREWLSSLAHRLMADECCSREEALRLCEEWTPLEALLDASDRLRAAACGDKVQACAIVNARSGACRENCRFCAQSAHHETKVDVYKLRDADTLVAAAVDMRDSGVSTFGIVTSGPTVTDDELDVICEAIRRIPEEAGLRPCASLGSLRAGQFDRLRESGLSRYHHNLETSRRFFPSICTTHTWDERVETVRRARDAGLEVCSGGLFGLGETWEDRVDMALTLRELAVDSVPVNFLNPVPGTPLEDEARLLADEGLRILAVYRFLLPKANIRVCGGRPSTLGSRQREMFRAGASAYMTGDYLTTSGISPETDRSLLEELGLRLDTDFDTPDAV